MYSWDILGHFGTFCRDGKWPGKGDSHWLAELLVRLTLHTSKALLAAVLLLKPDRPPDFEEDACERVQEAPPGAYIRDQRWVGA